MKKEKADLEKKVGSLIDTLAEVEETAAKKSIVARINHMNAEMDKLSQGMDEIVCLTAKHTFSDTGFSALCQALSVFPNTVEELSCEQKRVAVGSIVRRVVWDGEQAHVFLFGSPDGDIALPAVTDGEDAEDFRRHTKTDWGKDSK